MPNRRLYWKVRPLLRRMARPLLNSMDVLRHLDTHSWDIRGNGSRVLCERYATLLPGDRGAAVGLAKHEYKAYSQHGEDGILMFLLSQIGISNRRFVEFGVEDGSECNCANLAVNFGFSGLLMDGDPENVRRGRIFYDSLLGARLDDVKFVPCWITRENIDSVIREHGFSGELDVLSIDIDGNDYWVWKAMSAVNARIAVVEYNAVFGPDRSVTIPYEPAFNRWDKHPSGYYYGVSLLALERLAAQKRYRLVGCDSTGVNAFFVRDDIAPDTLPAVPARHAWRPRASAVRDGYSTEEQFRLIGHLPLEEV